MKEVTHIRLFIANLSIVLVCVLISLVSNAQTGVLPPVENNYSVIVQHRTYDTAAIKEMILTGQTLKKTSFDSAAALFEKAFDASKQIHYEIGLIVSLDQLAGLYSERGMYGEMLHHYQDALILCMQDKTMNRALLTVYNGIATLYQYRGDYADAAKYYYLAIFIQDHLTLHASTGLIYNNFASMLIHMQQYRQANFYLDKAEQLAKEKKNNSVISLVWVNKGVIYGKEKKWADALLYLNTALKLSREKNLVSIQALALTNIALIYEAKGELAMSLPYLLEIQKIKGDINPIYRTGAYETLGEVYWKLQRYDEAERYLLKALTITEQMHLVQNQIDTHNLLAKLYESKGNFAKALYHHKKYTQINDSVQNNTAVQSINQMEVKYRTAQKDKDIANKQLLITRQEYNLRRKNIWISIISAGALLFGFLFISIFRANKHKQNVQHKQIQLLQKEQEITLQQKEIEQLKAMMEGEEKERTRIARELHDGIGGMLAAMKMHFNSAKKQHPEMFQLLHFKEINSMMEDTATELRKTAHNLMPNILLRHNLIEALRIYSENINTGNQLQISLQSYGNLDVLSKSVELVIYRIVQELIQNVIKHADAKNTIIEMEQRENQLNIIVEDNGAGFDTSENSGGFGLQNLQYRIHALEGHITIESAIGIGTTVQIQFDIDKLQNTFES